MIGDKCCCCFPLRTGVLVLGALSVIGGIYNVIMGSIQLNNSEMVGYYVTTLITGIATTAFSILLILGVQKDRALFMTPYLFWMIFNVVATVGLGIFLVVEIAQGTSDTNSQGNLVALLIALILVIALSIYFILVVRKYRQVVSQRYV